MRSKSRTCFYLVLFIVCFFTNSLNAAFYKDLWPLWLTHNPLSTKTISHEEWQNFLNKYVVTNEEGINLIDYAHIDAKDVEQLKQYLSRLSQVKIHEYNRQEQLAFWLNLYNATVIYTVSRYYPVTSIEEINISPGLFSNGPWSAKLVAVNQIELTLDEIENRIIRPIWNDPRCHYALNNSAIGAANLDKKAFEGKTIDQQLNLAAASYINSMRGTQIIDNHLVVSKMYDWFLDDFGGSKKNVIHYLQIYAQEPLRSQLAQIKKIDSYMYNWHLNSTVIQTL